MKSKKLLELSKLNSKLRRDSFKNYESFLRILLSTTEVPQAKAALSLLLAKDWNGLLDFADCLSSTVYTTAHEHRVCNQIAAVIRKYPFPDGLMNVDPEGLATEKFLASEHHCKRVNERFRLFSKLRCPVENELNRSRSYIKHVLGEFKLSRMLEDCAFSAGAAMGVHGDATNLARKVLSDSWTVTPGAYYYARATLKTDIHLFELLNRADGREVYSVDPDLFNTNFDRRAKIIDYNNISFVTKTVRVLRTIAVEPLLTGYLQVGAGEEFKKLLLRVGLDLSDQRKNQLAALKGSLDWESDDGFVTLDIKDASNCVSTGLCRNLLPPEWFEYLDSIRSHSYKLYGKVHPYHKFVSMGNGFCFPLETLIFASLCAAVYSERGLKHDFLVYGDDIIVRKSVFQPLVSLLKTCGFQVNPDKTFSEGPFRESCGADWFSGEDVRPINLKFALDSLQSIFKFCNACRSKPHTAMQLSEALDFLESLIPKGLKFVRPENYPGNADTALSVPMDVFMSSPFPRYNKKLMCWDWVELVTTSVPDKRVRRMARYDIALIMGALRGVLPSCPFSLRFTAITKIRRVSYAGGWSIIEPGFIAGKVLYLPTE